MPTAILQNSQRKVLCGNTESRPLPVLAGAIESPYYRTTAKERTGRVNNLTLTKMAIKAVIKDYIDFQVGHTQFTIDVGFLDTSSDEWVEVKDLDVTLPNVDSLSYRGAIRDKILGYANNTQSYGITADDIDGLTTVFRTFNNNPGRSIVTGTGATGFQPSSTRDAFVTYSPTIVTTATIAGGQDGEVVLEIAATNSATAGDWKEIARTRNGQALSLALTLQSVQTTSAPLVGMVPAGWYAKIRSINVVGTPSYSYVSGQEVLL